MNTHRLFTVNSYLKYRVLVACPQTVHFLFFFGQFDTADFISIRALDDPYCAFQKHVNSEVQKPPQQVRFFAAVNHNYDHKQRSLKHRNTQNGSKSTNHKPWPFEPMEVNVRFLGPLRQLTAGKNANVSWFWKLKIRVLMKKKRVCGQATLHLKNGSYKNSQIVLKSTFFVDRIPLNIFARFSVLLVQ